MPVVLNVSRWPNSLPILLFFVFAIVRGSCSAQTRTQMTLGDAKTAAASQASNSGQMNGVFLVDGIKFPNIAAVESACGATNNCWIWITPQYTGSDCPAGLNNATYLDTRQIVPIPGCGNNTLTILSHGVDGLVRTGWRFSYSPQSLPPGIDEIETVTNQGSYSGDLDTAQVFDGIGLNVGFSGTVSGGGAAPTIGGIEAHCNTKSTGNLAHTPNCQSAVFGSRMGSGNTTNFSIADDVLLQTITNSGSGALPNAWGIRMQPQTAGSSSNCGIASDTLGSSSKAVGAICFANNRPNTDSITWLSAGGGNLQVYVDGANNLVLPAPLNVRVGNSLSFGGGAPAFQATAPSIAYRGCGGSDAGISGTPNGTAAFAINVGTSPGTACTIAMPAATTGWNCDAFDRTNPNTAGGYLVKETADSTTSITLTFYNTSGVATSPTASDVIRVKCAAY